VITFNDAAISFSSAVNTFSNETITTTDSPDIQDQARESHKKEPGSSGHRRGFCFHRTNYRLCRISAYTGSMEILSEEIYG